VTELVGADVAHDQAVSVEQGTQNNTLLDQSAADAHAEDPKFDTETQYGDESDRRDEPMTFDQIKDALVLTTQDRNGSFMVRLNRRDLLYSYVCNPVKYGGGRKMFKCVPGMDKLLYWWLAFGAMISCGKLILTPCIIELRDGRICLLQCLLETMCFRPRYDGLIVDLETNEVTVFKNIFGQVKKHLLHHQYDHAKTDKYVFQLFDCFY
jgi:hypothetical protein